LIQQCHAPKKEPDDKQPQREEVHLLLTTSEHGLSITKTLFLVNSNCLANWVEAKERPVVDQFEICSGVGLPVFLTRCAPDFPRGIGVHRRNPKPNDQIGPSGKRIGRHEPRRDDRDVSQGIISS